MVVVSFCASEARALDRTSFDELSKIIDSTKVLEANVIASRVFEKAYGYFLKAQRSLESPRDQRSLEKSVARAHEYTENAIRTGEVALNICALMVESRTAELWVS